MTYKLTYTDYVLLLEAALLGLPLVGLLYLVKGKDWQVKIPDSYNRYINSLLLGGVLNGPGTKPVIPPGTVPNTIPPIVIPPAPKTPLPPPLGGKFISGRWKELTAVGGFGPIIGSDNIAHLILLWNSYGQPATGWQGVNYGYCIAARGQMDWGYATQEDLKYKFIDVHGKFIESIPYDTVTGTGNTPVPWDWNCYFEMQFELSRPVTLNGFTSKFLDAQVDLASAPLDPNPSTHTQKSHHVRRDYMQVVPGGSIDIVNFDVNAHYQWAITKLGLPDVGWIKYGTGPGVEGYRAKSLKADFTEFTLHD